MPGGGWGREAQGSDWPQLSLLWLLRGGLPTCVIPQPRSLDIGLDSPLPSLCTISGGPHYPHFWMRKLRLKEAK